MRDLKNLVEEVETLLDQNSSQLSTDVRQQLELKLADLKKECDVEDEQRKRQLMQDALNILGHLIGIVTNVMTLLK